MITKTFVVTYKTASSGHSYPAPFDVSAKEIGAVTTEAKPSYALTLTSNGENNSPLSPREELYLSVTLGQFQEIQLGQKFTVTFTPVTPAVD